MHRERSYKIDLQISRRRRTAHASPPRQVVPPKQLLTLTMASRTKFNPRPNPERLHPDKNIVISQFSTEQGPLPVNPGAEREFQVSVVQHSLDGDNAWWRCLKQQRGGRAELLSALKEKEKKVLFFKSLLQQKRGRFRTQKRQKITRYEEYLANLSKLHQEELKSLHLQQQAKDALDAEKGAGGGAWEEDLFRRIRHNINRDGKQGLNFTPKQVSVFSGASETILIEDSCLSRREEYFSFGSSQNSMSAPKPQIGREFLNPGRACVSKRKLDYSEDRS